MAEDVEPFKLNPMSIAYLYDVFDHLLKMWMGIWLHNCIVTTTDASQFGKGWLKSYLMQVCKPCHYALIEAVEPFKLHPMSMSYLYEMFERLLRLWMGIQLHTHTNTTTDASPDM
jgi:hypothetical protein